MDEAPAGSVVAVTGLSRALPGQGLGFETAWTVPSLEPVLAYQAETEADPSAARDAMLHTMACKAAIKGGWSSDPSELKVLIRKVQSGEGQFCPHGRPVKVCISKYEVEKMFRRA